MARVRTLKKVEPKKGALSPLGWDQLMRLAIRRAEATGDKRLEGLRKALRDGKSEMLLRKLGVISEDDLPREFPDQAQG